VEQVGEQRNEYKTNEGDAAAGHELLDALRLRAGVVVAVALKEVDAAPDAETAAESDNKSLKNVNSACKEIHIDFAGIIWEGRFVPEKSKAGMRPLSAAPDSGILLSIFKLVDDSSRLCNSSFFVSCIVSCLSFTDVV
jgi:hypothetical protein